MEISKAKDLSEQWEYAYYLILYFDMLGIFLHQKNDLELYISVAKCLSEMTDDEANRVAQITEVITYPCVFSLLKWVLQLIWL